MRSTASFPDFGGFLVKANSEGQPGPRTYNRNHVDGANMLAAAVAPHDGIVIWRAFVYDMKDAATTAPARPTKICSPSTASLRLTSCCRLRTAPSISNRASLSIRSSAECRRRSSCPNCRSRRNTWAFRITSYFWPRCGASSSIPTRTPKAPARPSRKWRTAVLPPAPDRHRGRGQHRIGSELVRPSIRSGQLVRLRSSGLEPGHSPRGRSPRNGTG